MKKLPRKLQIGVVGSAADLKYSKKMQSIAYEVGKMIAESGAIVVYGAEKDYDSLSTAAARGAKEAGGITVGITYGRGKNIWDKSGSASIVIVTGVERGGGREFVLVNSCDVIIVISGGSGTLTEMAMAYQMDIPIIAVAGTGGWADKLAGKYIDKRRRLRILKARTPRQAVISALNVART